MFPTMGSFGHRAEPTNPALRLPALPQLSRPGGPAGEPPCRRRPHVGRPFAANSSAARVAWPPSLMCAQGWFPPLSVIVWGLRAHTLPPGARKILEAGRPGAPWNAWPPDCGDLGPPAEKSAHQVPTVSATRPTQSVSLPLFSCHRSGALSWLSESRWLRTAPCPPIQTEFDSKQPHYFNNPPAGQPQDPDVSLSAPALHAQEAYNSTSEEAGAEHAASTTAANGAVSANQRVAHAVTFTPPLRLQSGPLPARRPTAVP